MTEQRHKYLSSAVSIKAVRQEVKRIEGFNAKVAVAITSGVGTMFCAYVFCAIALVSLPAILNQTGWFAKDTFPSWMIAPGLILVVAWVAQTFIQLVLLSIIMVGQSVQGAASDARAEKTLADTETILDKLNLETEGGIKEILDAIISLRTGRK